MSMNLVIVFSLFFATIFGEVLECNYINMGFNLIQPANECAVGKSTGGTEMSMGHFCIDNLNKIETRIWSNNDCSGNQYEITNTFDCNSNTTFVKCNCQSQSTSICTTVIDTQYVKEKDGGCDTSQITEFRKYIVDNQQQQQCPDTFIDNNCFERSCNKKS